MHSFTPEASSSEFVEEHNYISFKLEALHNYTILVCGAEKAPFLIFDRKLEICT